MSTLFFDKLITLDKLDKKIKKVTLSNNERQELWKYIDEIIHHRVLGCCLEHLPKEHHIEFLEKFHKAPYDEKILDYLESKIEKDIRKIIKEEVKEATKDLHLD